MGAPSDHDYQETGEVCLSDLAGHLPPKGRLSRGPVVVVECLEEIPCNPCAKVCPSEAIRVEPSIKDLPVVDYDRCTGCGLCVAVCPGLAIFIVDVSSSNQATIKLPYEMLPQPKIGGQVALLNRQGKQCGIGEVLAFSRQRGTGVVTLAVDKKLAMQVRNIEVGQ